MVLITDGKKLNLVTEDENIRYLQKGDKFEYSDAFNDFIYIVVNKTLYRRWVNNDLEKSYSIIINVREVKKWWQIWKKIK